MATFYDPRVHHRKTMRLENWDYTWAWWYYVTVCTKERACALGRVHDGVIERSPHGEVVYAQWRSIPTLFPTVDLDEFVVMPDHLHGIVILNGPPREDHWRGLINQTPTDALWILMRQRGISLGKVLRAFKARAARVIRASVDPGFGWQRGFYDHIIRNDLDLDRIRSYIRHNPRKWAFDEERSGRKC